MVALVRRSVVVAAAAVVWPLVGCTTEVEDPVASLDQSLNQYDPNWSCYAPAPGHPTREERTHFVESNAPAAQEAERLYGVPAAALLAMATNEGGYGFTRTGIYANNTFGWKWTSATAAGGRPAYTLHCQPSWDPGNKYIVFHDVADGFLFVAQRLATMSTYANYKAATDRYKADRRAGVPVITAVNRWIDGIADAGYNYDPPTYKRTIKAHANDYQSPGSTYSPERNLYRYSAAITHGAPGPDGSSGSGGSQSSWVAVDAPSAYATVSGDVALRATASADVTSVKFWSAPASSPTSRYLIAHDTEAPFAANWATTGWVPSGEYDLVFEAYAGDEKRATGTIRVTVQH